MRLHTFEPEDRAYTSTPTKIGGHALDHVVGVTLEWSRALNNNKSNAWGGRAFVVGEGGCGAACSTTLEPRMGRFGGLSFAVHSPRRYLPEPPPCPVLMPPLYPTLAVLPPDTLAPRSVTADADVSWQWHRRLEYGPEWVDDNRNEGGEVEAVAPLDGGSTSSTNPASIVAASAGASGGAAPYRNMATSATGHSGALMAILLSKLANSGYSAPSAGEAPPEAAVAAAAPSPSRAELLHRSVDSIARGLGGSAVGPDAADPIANGGGSWAWKARVDQTPHYSKLRRYHFVRELGSGSHGTILLVRKRPAANDHAPSSGGGGGGGGLVFDNYCKTSSGGGPRRRSGTGSDDHRRCCVRSSGRDPGGGFRSPPGGLRVLKESPFLPEAVNEARLLLLAGGGGGVANDLDSRGRTGGAGVGDGGVGGVATAGRRGGDGVKGYQRRGDVVQVRTRAVMVPPPLS